MSTSPIQQSLPISPQSFRDEANAEIAFRAFIDPCDLARKLVSRCRTFEDIQKETAKLSGHYTGTPEEDAFFEAFYTAAQSRRVELRSRAECRAVKQHTARVRTMARYPAPLPSIRLTLLEKREAARRRRELADFLVHQIPAAFIARLPECGAAPRSAGRDLPVVRPRPQPLRCSYQHNSGISWCIPVVSQSSAPSFGSPTPD